MATKIENTITAVEALVLDVYARTNRAGPLTCTVAAGWTTTAGNVSAITLTRGTATKTVTVSASELIGSHLVQGGVARRITDNGATASGVTALTCTTWTTAPTAGAAELRDGFRVLADDALLADIPQDRVVQMVLGIPRRDPDWGVQGTGRWRLRWELQVAYLYGYDYQVDAQRIAEDIEALTNAVLDQTNEPTGVLLYTDGDATAASPIIEGEGESAREIGMIVRIPFIAQYAATTVES